MLTAAVNAQGRGRGPGGEPPADLVRPSVTAQRTAEPIEIDGNLTEAAWASAGVISDLTQVEPEEGAEPTERTEVLLLYDDDNLYIGVRAYDSEPDRIRATEMERDADLESDDFVVIALDTFLDRRNGYRFSTNPLGARAETLIENNKRLKAESDWDGIWNVRSTITAEGWVAEFVIPFKTVSFDESKTTWGFNIERSIRRKTETARWSGVGISRGIDEIGLAGDLMGLVGIKQGLGIDWVVGSSLTYLPNYRGTKDNDLVGDPFSDVFYRVTPRLTAAFTWNTDFAETEVDERVINLDRFDVFFPEKRDFFLQDAGIFEFGNINRNGRPFFSRRIGLDDEDQDVDIIDGVKVTGRAGPLNIGALAVKQDKSESRDRTELFVLRPSLNVLSESRVGMIVTDGNPTEDEDNRIIGFDFLFRDSESLPEDQVVEADIWFQKAYREDVEDNNVAFGTSLRYPNEPVELEVSFQEIQQEFRPALGFANRRGARSYTGEGRYRFRMRPDSYVRFIDNKVSAEVVEKIVLRKDEEEEEEGPRKDFIETAETSITPLSIRTRDDDSLEFGYKKKYERLIEEHEIVEDVIIPVGAYHNDLGFIKLSASSQRMISGDFEIEAGEFFDGTSVKIKPVLRLRPSRHLLLSAEYEQNDVNLDGGDFVTRLLRGRVRVQFSPDLTWNTLIEWDNLSRVYGINSHVRWTVEPGSDLFLVARHSTRNVRETEPASRNDSTEVIGKVQWTFRY